MARTTTKAAPRDTVTVGEIVEMVKQIEAQCRAVRMLLQRLDKTAQVKLTEQLKRSLEMQVRKVPGSGC